MNMNKLSNLIVIVIMAFGFFACEPVEDMFDETLLIGKWQSVNDSKTEFYRYDINGRGATWDTADDVTEAEGQVFTWKLVNADLTHIHIMEIGGSGVPKNYTVTVLSATSLIYHDEFNKTFSYTKVK
jgi:hypothetical protein